MNEVRVKSNLCRIFHRQGDKKVLLFGCGCLVKCNDGSLKIATSREILNLTDGEIFAKFDATRDQENKLQINTEEREENPGSENGEIAYFSIDMNAFEQLPVGLCEANNLVAVEEIACRVAVLENLEQFGDTTDFKFYSVEKDQGKCTLKIECGINKRVLERKADFQPKHLKVLGSPIVSFQEDCKFLGIVDFLQVESDFLLRLVYRGTPRSFTDKSKQAPKNSRVSRETGAEQEISADQEIDSGRAKLSLADPLDKLWNNNIYFRGEFSEVLDRTYKEIGFWPHLAEQFGIDKCIYEAFSTSDITSPTERMLEYLETREPTLNVKEFCKSLKTADALEVRRIVKKCVEDGKLSEMDLVTEMCDKVPRCLDTIILKLDRVDRLWKNLARARGIPQKKFLAFQSATNDNPTRVFFDLLRTEAPNLRIQDFREKLKALGLENLIEILKNSEIRDDMPLDRLSKHPDVKSTIESILNELKTKFLWTLASRYQKEGLMQTIDIETLFRPKEQVDTPTCKVIEYALASRSKITTIEDLIIKLRSMRREDCVQIIVPYLKGGKQEIDKITQGTQNLQIGSCDEGNQFAYGEEEQNGTQVTTEQLEANNKFIQTNQ